MLTTFWKYWYMTEHKWRPVMPASNPSKISKAVLVFGKQ